MKKMSIYSPVRIKALGLAAVTVVVTLFNCSCNNTPPKPVDIRSDNEKAAQLKTDSINREADVKFLVRAAEIYLEEIKLGELAQKKSKSADVKALGFMMVTAHTNSLKDLTALAGDKKVTLPTQPAKDAEDAYRLLNDKPLEEFDKAYCTRLASAHNLAIEIFELASQNSNDADIKKMAEGELLDLDTHLYHIVACRNKLDAKVK